MLRGFWRALDRLTAAINSLAARFEAADADLAARLATVDAVPALPPAEPEQVEGDAPKRRGKA